MLSWYYHVLLLLYCVLACLCPFVCVYVCSFPVLEAIYFHFSPRCVCLRCLASQSDPPVVLQCGHVMNKSSANSLAAANRRVVSCSYCPVKTKISEIVEMKRW
eukprot:m.41771 g.41771  ORF g.41771 m.41771 type:complete len:103 (+) comp7022_c0_seq2:50-358(+)